MTFICIVAQGFFAMMEMAFVSFNKVRLQYYVSKKVLRAKWLSFLLNHPALLFGATLIGVNAALLLGSECSRRLYEAVGADPDFAPLTQIIFVLIFAEITPIVAGRRYAEHASMLGVPIVFALAIVLSPVIWLLDILCQLVNRMLRIPKGVGLYLTRDELQKIIEEREEAASGIPQKKEEFNTIVANIFSLRSKTAKELMIPIQMVKTIPATSNLGDMKNLLIATYASFVPLYHRSTANIVAIAYPRDLLRFPDHKKVREHARPPWFITEMNSIMQILKQFRRNNQSVAVVLNQAGLAVGILTLDDILDEIFGGIQRLVSGGPVLTQRIHLDLSLPGNMPLSEFNEQFNVKLEYEDAETLEDVVRLALGHSPSKGETVRIGEFELEVEEPSLLGAKMISVRTLH